MNNLRKAIGLLENGERRQAGIVLGAVIIMALFDTLGTMSIMPFLAVIANPGVVDHNHLLRWAYVFLGFSEKQGFVFFLGLVSFGFLILSALVRGTGQYAVNRFTQMRSYSIGRRLFSAYLRRPYAYFLAHHTGDLSKVLLAEVNIAVAQVYQPLSVIVAQGTLLVVMVTLLLAVNPIVALVGIALIGACYVFAFMTVRQRITQLGQSRALAERERFRLASEALGGIKTVKILGRERHYVAHFEDASLRLARNQATSQTLGVLPRYAIEAVAFGGIILLTLVLMVHYAHSDTGALSHVLPQLGLYAFAGYRMMPAFQAVYQALSQINYGMPALEAIASDLAGNEGLPPLPHDAAKPLPFFRRIALREISFRHEGAPNPSLAGVSLIIPKGSTLGIVGSTGAGKTTLMDIFLGLLTPSGGDIQVDDQTVTPENLRNWQADLGYVPQDIFLVDASVAENIALGYRPEEIDRERVRDCARLAQILDFIDQDLPQGIDTAVGERGVRLSGGQRQRIGIARALYNDPGILVFDEATSALDNLTEKEVVRAINALTGSRTILIVAHRLSTVMNCDQILVLDRGRTVGLGTYEELCKSNPAFRRMVDARAAG